MSKKYKQLVVYKRFNNFQMRFEQKSFVRLDNKFVRIKMLYSNINYKDFMVCSGMPGLTRKYPHTPGIDGAGVVVESKTKKFKVNDHVFIVCQKVGVLNTGTFSEYIDLNEKFLFKKSKNISLKETMLIGTSGLTAFIAIEKLSLKNNSKNHLPIIVTGASGNVGIMSLFFLKLLKRDVIALTSKKQIFKLKSIKLKKILFRSKLKTASFLQKKEYGGIIDNIGGEYIQNLINLLQKKSTAVLIGIAAGYKTNLNLSSVILENLKIVGINAEELSIKEKKIAWSKIEKIIKKNKIPREIYRTVKFDKIVQEIKKYNTNKNFGKCLIKF